MVQWKEDFNQDAQGWIQTSAPITSETLLPQQMHNVILFCYHIGLNMNKIHKKFAVGQQFSTRGS